MPRHREVSCHLGEREHFSLHSRHRVTNIVPWHKRVVPFCGSCVDKRRDRAKGSGARDFHAQIL